MDWATAMICAHLSAHSLSAHAHLQVIVSLATGSGKTLIAAEVIKRKLPALRAAKKVAVFLAPTNPLVAQARGDDGGDDSEGAACQTRCALAAAMLASECSSYHHSPLLLPACTCSNATSRSGVCMACVHKLSMALSCTTVASVHGSGSVGSR